MQKRFLKQFLSFFNLQEKYVGASKWNMLFCASFEKYLKNMQFDINFIRQELHRMLLSTNKVSLDLLFCWGLWFLLTV